MKHINLKDHGVNNVKQIFLLDQMTGGDGDLFAYWFSWSNPYFLSTPQSLDHLKTRMERESTYPGSGFAPKLMKDTETNYNETIRVLTEIPDERKQRAKYILMTSHPGSRVYKYYQDGKPRLTLITEFGSTFNSLDDFPFDTTNVFKIILLFSNFNSFLYTAYWFSNFYHSRSEADTGDYDQMLERITGYYGPTASNIINSNNFDDNFIAVDFIDLMLNQQYDKIKTLIEKLSCAGHAQEKYDFLLEHWQENRLKEYNAWVSDFKNTQPEKYVQLKEQFENNKPYHDVLERLSVVNSLNIDKYLKTHYNV